MSDSGIIKRSLAEGTPYLETADELEENKERETISDADADADGDLSEIHIPTDIIFSDILTRVPVKSLLRFKSVSKTWCSWMHNDPFFVNLHIARSPIRHGGTGLLVSARKRFSGKQLCFSVNLHEGGLEITPLLKDFLPRNVTISHNVKGLTLFSVFRDEFAVICNPSTREFLSLPPHSELTGFDPAYSFGVLPSNPSPSTLEILSLPPNSKLTGFDLAYSFGVLPSTNKFKVLCINILRLSVEGGEKHCISANRFYIIEKSAKSWRRIEPPLPFDIDIHMFREPGICVNGTIHWMLLSQRSILSFDLKTEEFGLIPLPRGASSFDVIKDNLIQIGGCLTVVGGKPVLPDNVLNLWIMEDYQNQIWVKESIIFPWPWLHVLRPVSSVHNGEILLIPIDSQMSIQWAFYYDLKTQHVWSIYFDEVYKLLPKRAEIWHVSTYTESLLSLRSSNR